MAGWSWLGWLAAVAVALAAAEGWALMRCRSIARELERAVEALGEGRPARTPRARFAGPLSGLVRAFDAVIPGLEARIGRLDREVEQLRVVLGGMAEAVIAVDSRRRLLFANRGADHLFGLDARAVGRLVPELIRSPRIQEAVDATLAGPDAYRGEVELPVREVMSRSTPRVLAVRGAPLPGPSPSGAVLVFHDVTELRRLERMRQDFVANASHELKTPLASIKAYTETLLDGALHDEEVNVRFLTRIEEQAERLDRLILDLLALARLESGRDVIGLGPTAVAPLIVACVEAQRGRAESKGLALGLDLGPIDADTLVAADEEAIRQVVDNLVDNAIKYTPQGGWVRVACRLEGGSVALAVADSGIGIPRADLPRVFERFYRVDKARSREIGGTGLGLSIVKHVLQSIGGSVEVESRVSEGSRFDVRLPLAESP